MDPTVPPSAALLLDFIREIETGRKGREAYDVIYGHAQGKLPKPITQMTIAELQRHQSSGWPAKSTASGAYQFMRATLADLRRELKLLDGQVFDPNLQDRLGYHLLKRRGYEAFMAGHISRTEFGRRLAMEWASLPVLASVKGAHRTVQRGQSYYAGDGLNKSLVEPSRVETILDRAKHANGAPLPPDVPVPAPSAPPDTKRPPATPAALAIAIVLAALVAAFFIFLR
ncbi:hypothetical protein [Pelagibacterium lacus]|uniref:Transmembrane protein n=1 Tax=Pelagibacterium lacus TaxID=2282655 RepID=A0A369W7V2_9HYPH|nr:hypothetical protein [Pelagibacterium lacus]RDE10107.1 hypothetical protein DVH29_01550 [Pelagibacterium lacus]